LREPFAEAFTALGFEGEEGWRVAARIKVLLLTGAGVGKAEETAASAENSEEPKAWVEADPVAEEPAAVIGKEAPKAAEEAESSAGDETPVVAEELVALAPALWLDPDVRWLTGIHEAGGHEYLVREAYEELLWWLQVPALLRLAGESLPSRAEVEEMSKTIEEALASAESAGYRVDLLLGPALAEDEGEETAAEEAEGFVVEDEAAEAGEGKPAEPEIEPPGEPVKPA
jgi:hypothetical protein